MTRHRGFNLSHARQVVQPIAEVEAELLPRLPARPQAGRQGWLWDNALVSRSSRLAAHADQWGTVNKCTGYDQRVQP